jgi:abequosyltransferase
MSESQPLLSICIPTYNRVEYLKLCLDSFIAQVDGTIANEIEIIISDNASPDSTKDVAEIYCRTYPWIKFIQNQQNIGAELNIFAAIKDARGEFAWLFGDDDIILSGTLKKVFSYLSSSKHDLFLLNKIVKDKGLVEVLLEKQNITYGDIGFLDIKDLASTFGLVTNLGFISAVIFRRIPFLKVDYYPYLNTLYPQVGVWLEAFKQKPCLYVSEPLVCQRQFNAAIVDNHFLYGMVNHVHMFKTLVLRRAFDYALIEQIKEHPLNQATTSLGDMILAHLQGLIQQNKIVSDIEWDEIFDVFLSPRKTDQTQSMVRIVDQLFTEYQKRHKNDAVKVIKQKHYTTYPDLSVVILSLTDTPRVWRILDQLSKQTIPRHQYELIWVDTTGAEMPVVRKQADVILDCSSLLVSDAQRIYEQALRYTSGVSIVVVTPGETLKPDFIEMVMATNECVDGSSELKGIFTDSSSELLRQQIIAVHGGVTDNRLQRQIIQIRKMLARGHTPRALEASKHLVAQFGAYSSAWLIRAIVLRNARQYQDALSAADQSLRLGETPVALMEVFKIFGAMNEIEHARKVGKYLQMRFPGWNENDQRD